MRITNFLSQINRLTFIFIAIIFGVLLNFVLSYAITELLSIDLGNQNDTIDFPENMKLIFEVVIAPFFETAFFQYFFIVLIPTLLFKLNLISKITKKHYTVFILLSAFLFALTHIFSLLYFLFAFLMGVYFGYITVISEFSRKKKVNVFISVGITHSAINLLAIICE